MILYRHSIQIRPNSGGMRLNIYTNFAGFTVQTYTLILSLSIVLSIGLLLVLNRQLAPARLFDLAVGALIGALIMARVGHVVLYWDYFSSHLAEIPRYDMGGLDWHGAAFGGLAGLWLAARLRRVTLSPILDSLALILPLLTLAGWRGCMAAACAYGSEITRMAAYPPLLVWEASDSYGLIAPRYATQLLGTLMAVVLLLLAIFLHHRNWLPGQRFWFMLILAGAGMFLIGFLRGDPIPTFASSRFDQWLDLLMVITGLIGSSRTPEKEL
jgi:phosphatidylglycerol:prolipoprotein diacylglycerol transferase